MNKVILQGNLGFDPELRAGLGKSIMFNDISELRVSRIEMV